VTGMDATTGKPLAGADHLRQSIADILGTPVGTRLARRDYGSLLPELLDQPLNELTRLRVFAAGALALMRQEPRLRAARFRLAPGDQPGSALLTVEGDRTDGAAPRPFLATIPIRARRALA
jgi:phage baseplate assembly protein W